MSQGQLHRELEKVYAQVPVIDCRGNCWDTCTRFPVTRAENRRLRRETGQEIEPAGRQRQLPPCPLLVNLRCSAYDIRPLLCRLWGASQIFPCNYGCVPAAGLLSVKTTYLLLARAYELSGQTGMARDCAEIAEKPDAELEAMAPALKALAWGKIDYSEARARRDRALGGLTVGGLTVDGDAVVRVSRSRPGQ
jgi:uncharacterized protein